MPSGGIGRKTASLPQLVQGSQQPPARGERANWLATKLAVTSLISSDTGRAPAPSPPPELSKAANPLLPSFTAPAPPLLCSTVSLPPTIMPTSLRPPRLSRQPSHRCHQTGFSCSFSSCSSAPRGLGLPLCRSVTPISSQLATHSSHSARATLVAAPQLTTPQLHSRTPNAEHRWL